MQCPEPLEQIKFHSVSFIQLTRSDWGRFHWVIWSLWYVCIFKYISRLFFRRFRRWEMFMCHTYISSCIWRFAGVWGSKIRALSLLGKKKQWISSCKFGWAMSLHSHKKGFSIFISPPFSESTLERLFDMNPTCSRKLTGMADYFTKVDWWRGCCFFLLRICPNSLNFFFWRILISGLIFLIIPYIYPPNILLVLLNIYLLIFFVI